MAKKLPKGFRKPQSRQETVLICAPGSFSDNSRSAEGSSILNSGKAMNSTDVAVSHNFKKKRRKPDNFTGGKKINELSLASSAFHSVPQPLRLSVSTGSAHGRHSVKVHPGNNSDETQNDLVDTSITSIASA